MINQIISPFAKYLPENNTFERIWVLAKVDFKSRYYYHKLGVIWALIRPIFELAVYYVIFKTVFKNSIEHFELFLFGGLLVWYFFVEGTTKGTSVLRSKLHLIDSIQFDKKGLFFSSTISAFLGFLFNLIAYIIISFSVGVIPFSMPFLMFPILIILLSFFIMGVSMLLATMSIYLKDIQHLWDMVILAGFWATPIVYSMDIVPEEHQSLFLLNPMANVVIATQDILLYSRFPSSSGLIYLAVVSFVVFGLGVLVFDRFSHKAAEKF